MKSKRIRRSLAVAASVPAVLLVGASAASADPLPTTPPVVGTKVAEMGGALSNGILDGFTTLLPFVIPVMIVFTIWGLAKRLTGAKKTGR